MWSADSLMSDKRQLCAQQLQVKLPISQHCSVPIRFQKRSAANTTTGEYDFQWPHGYNFQWAVASDAFGWCCPEAMGYPYFPVSPPNMIFCCRVVLGCQDCVDSQVCLETSDPSDSQVLSELMERSVILVLSDLKVNG